MGKITQINLTPANIEKHKLYLAVRIGEGLKWLNGTLPLGLPSLTTEDREVLAMDVYRSYVELVMWLEFNKEKKEWC